MSALLAFDAANPNVSISAMVKRGAIVAPVYVVGTPGGFAHADAARVRALRAAGLAPLPNWERAADFFARCTIAQAQAAGAEALAACRALEFPDDGSIDVAFSFDFEIPAADYPAMAARLDACERGLAGHYRAIVYAQIGFIEYLATLPRFAGRVHWLMGSTWRATSQFTGREAGSPNVGLIQSHDAAGNWLTSPIADTDVNTVTHPRALRAWWPTSSPYAKPSPSDLLEEIMALPGAPKTYAEFLDDVRAAISSAPVTNAYGEKGTVEGLLRAIDKHVNDSVPALAAVAAVVNDTVKRVAQLQAAQTPPAPTGQPTAVDADALAAAAAAAVVSELGKLTWGVK